MKKNIVLYFILSFAFSQGEGGENVDLLGHLEFGQNTSDITGFYQDGREFVAIGLQNASAIVDVTDPFNPYEIIRIPGGNSMWRDLKYWDRYVYVGTEANNNNGIQVISLDDPDNPVLVYTINDMGNSHNIHIDTDGFLYVVGASGCDIWIYNLENPANPIQVGCWNGEYIHDLEVYNNKAYACGIYSGVFYIIDLENKSNPYTIISYQTDSGGSYSTHDAAVTFDENYLIIGDESPGAIISIYDISNYNNINKISEYYTDGYSGDGYLYRSAHNVYIQESTGLLITSFYIDGTRFIDIADPSDPIEVGYYDTSDGDLATQGDPYYGNWGTYVDLPSGNIVSSDIENGLFVLGYNYAPAELSYNPGTFEFNLSSNSIVNEAFELTNTGEAESILTYNLNVSPFESPADGPDSNDNFWSDSDNEPNLSYDWIDISNIGTQYNFSNNDDGGSTIEIGFDFEFYGQNYSQCIINPNGWVGFGSDSDEWDNAQLPSSSAPSPAIFGFWDDLNPVNDNCNEYCSGNVYYHSNNERMVIWFNEVAHWWTNFENSFYDFQIVLYATGEVRINYNTMTGNYESGTVGMQNAGGTVGFEMSYNDSYVHDELSISFKQSPAWLSISPDSGDLLQGNTVSHSIEADAINLNEGDYSSFIVLQSNAGSQVMLPVNLSVGEMGLLGDVNQDGIINILDVVSAVNFVIDQDEPSNYEFWATDINMDGLLNVLDIVQMINLVLDD